MAIHATVDQTLCVRSAITSQSANVFLDMVEMLTPVVLDLLTLVILILVEQMLYVKWILVAQFVTVPKE